MAQVEISPMTIISDFSREESLDFICDIDLAYADVGFTETLIIRLAKSIKGDLSDEEWQPYQKFIDSLHEN